VPVRNGGCQWSDNFSESIWVSRNNSAKEIDDFVLKLIVAMVLSLLLLCTTFCYSSVPLFLSA